MLSNYHTLHYTASTLASALPGRTIGGIFTQEKDEAVMTFSGLEESLILSCRPGWNILYLKPAFSRARANSADVLRPAWSQRIVSVSMQGSDRLIRFGLESGFSLYARFYGAKANLLCVDESGGVIDAFKHAKELVGSRFTEPVDRTPVYNVSRVTESLRDMQGTVSTALKTLFPTLGSTAVREILFRAGISLTCAASGLDSRGLRSLGDALASVAIDLDHPRARIYNRPGQEDEPAPLILSIIPLHHLGPLPDRAFDDINEAIRHFIAGRRKAEGVERTRERITRSISTRVERAERTLVAIRDDLAKSNREEEYRRAGSLILAHVQDLPKGSTSAALHDAPGTPEVKLVAALTPAQNAQRYFDKAKRARLMRGQAQGRISGLEEIVVTGTALLATLENIHTRDALQTFMNDSSRELEAFGLSSKGKEREQPPFRIFTVDGGFQVLAGKSSANNDLLTMKYAKPNDLWFHARGSSGSHVVLKVGTGAGEPSKKAKEQAASIAAYYSKMRNAKTVPVVMTERKYVRKPKGAPPGTVTLERERVMFANPSLPQER
ncbi:MAG: NFACT family protein [Ignavibacteria bacterium]|nr:NFACT family protein [Ignavibacteria bacterium]